MNVCEQIDDYIADQAQPKREDLRTLHQIMLKISPHCRLWYLDGKNAEGKVISNPSIGYGFQWLKYANGETKEFYQIGISANSSGISIYVMGLDNKMYLSQTYGGRLGKVTITGYCVKFRSLKDLDLSIVEEMVANHMSEGPAHGS